MSNIQQPDSGQNIPLRILFFIVLQKHFPEVIAKLRGKPLRLYLRTVSGFVDNEFTKNRKKEEAFQNSLQEWAESCNLMTTYSGEKIPAFWCIYLAEQLVEKFAFLRFEARSHSLTVMRLVKEMCQFKSNQTALFDMKSTGQLSEWAAKRMIVKKAKQLSIPAKTLIELSSRPVELKRTIFSTLAEKVYLPHAPVFVENPEALEEDLDFEKKLSLLEKAFFPDNELEFGSRKKKFNDSLKEIVLKQRTILTNQLSFPDDWKSKKRFSNTERDLIWTIKSLVVDRSPIEISNEEPDREGTEPTTDPMSIRRQIDRTMQLLRLSR